MIKKHKLSATSKRNKIVLCLSSNLETCFNKKKLEFSQSLTSDNKTNTTTHRQKRLIQEVDNGQHSDKRD